MKDFSSRLKDVMDERGFSQSDLARLLEITPTGVWNWLHNGVQPRPEMAAKIAQALGVNVNWLMRGVGPRNAETPAQATPSQAKTISDRISELAQHIADANGVTADRVKIQVNIVS
jgi:transcriptional regulator with XRE-family HTH domain